MHATAPRPDPPPAPVPRLDARRCAAAPLFAWPVIAAATSVVVGMFALVAAQSLPGCDHAALAWVETSGQPSLIQAMKWVTVLGEPGFLTPFVLGLHAEMAWRRRAGHALALGLLVVGGDGMVSLLKFLVSRPRPEVWHGLVAFRGYSFPSGHAALVTMLVVALVVFSWSSLRSPIARGLVVSTAALTSALVAASRVVLGVHYLTDVIAGTALGVAWAVLILFPLRSSWLPREPGAHLNPAGGVLALGVFVVARWVKPPQWLPSIPEAVLDLACVGLVVCGLWLRMATAAAPGQGRPSRADVGTLLLVGALALMLHDALVVLAGAIFVALFTAISARAGSAALPPPTRLRFGSRGGVDFVDALRREADVCCLSIAAIGLIELREWSAAAHGFSARGLSWLGALMVAALFLCLARRHGAAGQQLAPDSID